MPYYLIEVRDSDGNDCSVFDAIVFAESRDAASARLWRFLEERYPDDEGDGSYGTYHACNCACEHRKTKICARCADAWECSHGGITTNEDAAGAYGPQEFATLADARAAHAKYHELIDLSDVELPPAAEAK